MREQIKEAQSRLRSALWSGVQFGFLVVNHAFKSVETIKYKLKSPSNRILMNSWCISRYGRMVKRNFGDELNIYLIEELTGRKATALNFSKLNSEENLMMIGSVIEGFTNENTIIWGAGALFGGETQMKCKPKKVLAVRGPHTRSYLLNQGIDCPEVYGDPALLTPLVYKPKVAKKYKVGIIPHITELSNPIYKKLADKDGIHIISFSNYGDWHSVIDEMCQCEAIFSSSLHGLILSDAYKIPNVWISVTDKMGGVFKYYDYFDSVERRNKKCTILTIDTEMSELLEQLNSWYPIQFDPQPLINACPVPLKLSCLSIES